MHASSRQWWLLPWIIAITGGCCAVAVDLHNDEVQAAVIVLGVSGLILGGFWPSGAWRWALMLGLSIIVGDYAAPRLNLVAVAPQPWNWGALIALVPAFIATWLGRALRAMLGGPAVESR